jgi:hypothetical protein
MKKVLQKSRMPLVRKVLAQSKRRYWARITAPRRAAGLLSLLLLASPLLYADKTSTNSFTMELQNPEADLIAAVQAVADNHIISGTYVYEREKTLTEAVSEKTSSYFDSWPHEGHVLYKVRRNALSPRNFKDSSDIGVITVRYVIHATSDTTTHLEILAVFVEDGTHRVHPSTGLVESSEYAEVQKQLVSIQKDRQLAVQVREQRTRDAEEAAALAKQQLQETSRRQEADSSLKSLERRADELQHAIEVRISNPNAELKAAPFRKAVTLTKLPANSDVLVEILTTYWYGVETTDGHRGWIRRDQAVPLP